MEGFVVGDRQVQYQEIKYDRKSDIYNSKNYSPQLTPTRIRATPPSSSIATPKRTLQHNLLAKTITLQRLHFVEVAKNNGYDLLLTEELNCVQTALVQAMRKTV